VAVKLLYQQLDFQKAVREQGLAEDDVDQAALFLIV
jgi:hypothetical protein